MKVLLLLALQHSLGYRLPFVLSSRRSRYVSESRIKKQREEIALRGEAEEEKACSFDPTERCESTSFGSTAESNHQSRLSLTRNGRSRISITVVCLLASLSRSRSKAKWFGSISRKSYLQCGQSIPLPKRKKKKKKGKGKGKDKVSNYLRCTVLYGKTTNCIKLAVTACFPKCRFSVFRSSLIQRMDYSYVTTLF